MLQEYKVWAVIPAADLDRAVKFYADTLGLKKVSVNEEMRQAQMEAGGGSRIDIYERAPSKADHTLATFEVEDIEGEIAALKEKGVHMEEYDMGELKTVNGVATMGPEKAAWFKDSEGNILCLHETQETVG